MTFWTEERVEALRRLGVTQGLSYNQIARNLGCSRNTVIGKFHRLGLEKKRGVDEAMMLSRMRARRALRHVPKQDSAGPTIRQP